ncbi:MAG: prephenate dehydrogenase/arogenate dehydrogenase family protein [Desulfobulbaceae bacterium]|uniref:Prephenate dehydrogenase n=1 Tax=Candidatus Desulfobia pelagia TaxID=2841692 RepID=A0A8J6NDH5_9BACT|nr:prephenate dehydrogenase/arogenate dehydrogenase family protein [Candidatus Desulfobia pelagia]
MTTIAIIGPEGCHAWQAAKKFSPDCETLSFSHFDRAAETFSSKKADYLILPVYNTRIGGILKSFQVMEKINAYWIDNIVLPIHLSLASLDDFHDLKLIVGTKTVLRQCEDYFTRHHPEISLLAVPDLDEAISEMKQNTLTNRGVIEAENLLQEHGLIIREREVLPHNKTRFAILGRKKAGSTGYDATSLITIPLKDRVGMLFDTLGEFTRRGINILDMRVEADAKTQKLQIYLEVEGHIKDGNIKDTLRTLEHNVIQEPQSIKILGSYPRVDMRVKRIKKFGFIGTGDMSKWFARKLESEGYETILTGRSTPIRPEEMIADVDVVMICVPISKTPEAIQKYGSYMKDGQALVLLAGEAENTLNIAMEKCSQGVEIMLVHNLWGPAAVTMKDKNASVVRTPRSGALCSEFEAFLYKHGADICHDSPTQHDLLMGVGQKLPTTISVALAMALDQNSINTSDIGNHSTLTSLYGILAMARVHSQNPRTYAEIMSTGGEGRKIVRSFAENILKLIDLAESGDINGLCTTIEKSRDYLSSDFLKASMQQALAVDETLGRLLKS